MQMNEYIELVNERYNEYMFGAQKSMVDQAGFFNIGYWTERVKNIESSQISLIETLVERLPTREGKILDVACGKGASTKFLTRYFAPRNTIGINISPRQIHECKKIAPECTFMLMDAANLEFEDSTIDNILCIEAAFHFNTRYTFLSEACRVLKPGGMLAMSDILFRNDVSLPDIPAANYLPDLEAYREMLHMAGFKHATVEDSTARSIKPLLNHLKILTNLSSKESDKSRLAQSIESITSFYNRCICCCMVFATKQ